MDFNQAKDLILMSILSLSIGYVAYQIRTLVNSVNSLNIKIASMMIHLENQKEKIAAVEECLDGKIDKEMCRYSPCHI